MEVIDILLTGIGVTVFAALVAGVTIGGMAAALFGALGVVQVLYALFGVEVGNAITEVAA